MDAAAGNAPDNDHRPTERRQLTIVFCDLVDSTALSSAMDPEDLHELMQAYQGFCTQCIEAAGGYVARFAGDGVLAYFGYPLALEDAPQRALHAGLALCEVGLRLSRPDKRPLAVRVGIATGVVVVGHLVSQGARELAAAGQTPNLAARLQALAAPDTVVVSDTTRRLAEGVFNFRSLGLTELKGLPPTTAWAVVDRRPAVSRYDARRAAGVSPLVSRDAELERILDAWRTSREGRVRVVGIVGDPGIGKSRLLEEAHCRIGGQGPVLWLEGGGVSIYDHTPFQVVSQFASQVVDERGPLIGVPGDGASQGRDALMSAWADIIWSAADRFPVALVIEDLHWVDPSTLELLDRIVRSERERALLLIYTSRQDVSERWARGARHQVIVLDSLADEASAALATAATNARLVETQIRAVVSQAAGVPLYIEELARLVADQTDPAATRSLPPTLSDLLATRLEGLGPAKHHAEVAAVLGQAFPAALFAAMIELEGGDPEQALAALEADAIVIRREGAADGEYRFRHALIATAAYGALLKRARRAIHERAARLIVERFPEIALAQPQVLARHWTEAGDAERAVAAWEAAGTLANGRRAFGEAEHAYRQALAVLEATADLPDRLRAELRIRAAFNRVLQLTRGYSASEALQSSHRVKELAALVGDPDALSREERVRWRSVFTAGDYAQAEVIAEQVMVLTEAHNAALWRRTFRLRAGIQHGFYTGDLARGERDFLAWTAIEDGSHQGAGDDVLSMGIAGLIAEISGRRAIAEQRIEEALALAERRGPYDLAMAIHSEACFHHFARDLSRQARSAERLAEVAAESGFEYASHLATGWLAIADLEAGRAHEAHERAQAAIAGFERLGAGVSMVFWLSVLARAQHHGGDAMAALGSFARALSFNLQELAFRPEALLARGSVLRALGRVDEASCDFAEAERLSEGMGATLFRFRALNELAALELSVGDRTGAQRTLRRAQAMANDDLCPADLVSYEALRRT